MSFLGLDLAQVREGLATRALSAVELTKAYIQAVEAARDLNAFITETPEKALAMAEESDRRIAAGDARPLEGIPLAIKDLFCTEGVQTTAGSHILEGFVPPYESTVTSASLWDAGAVLAGQNQSRRVRHGLVQHHQLFRALSSIPGRRRARRGPWSPAGARAARPPPSPPGFAWAPPAPTPAARSASRRALSAASA